VVGRPQSGLGFPSGHAAVAAAMMTAASPHLSPPARGAGWTVVALVATARMYVGAHLPLDVAGGLLLGWTIGSSVRLAPGAVPALGAAAEGARSWCEEAAARLAAGGGLGLTLDPDPTPAPVATSERPGRELALAARGR
jgi:undecaprenyl-diphosphatase